VGLEAQGVLLASTAIVLLGMADDRFELDALTKLAGQVFTAGILLLYGIQTLFPFSLSFCGKNKEFRRKIQKELAQAKICSM
jgi:UDP-N-acetylmuramyl pentapeptide phosphotransferase/UDP-N-acetylglucosamine-1-phosphate transferase